MSYVRFGEGSDVYIFLAVGGWLECCGCALKSMERDVEVANTFQTTAGLLAHLDAHRQHGHEVPDFVYDDLRHDAEDNDGWIAAGAPEDWPWKKGGRG